MFLSVRVLPAVFKLIRLKSASWLEFEVKLLDATMLPPVRVIVCVTTSGALTSIVPETVIVSPSLTLSIACFNSSSVLTVLSTANTAVGSILSTIVRANNTDKNLAFMVSSYNYRFEFENLLCAGMCFRCFFISHSPCLHRRPQDTPVFLIIVCSYAENKRRLKKIAKKT